MGLIGVAEGFNYLTLAVNLESVGLGIVLAAAGALIFIGLFTSYSATAIAIGTVCRGLISSSIPPYALLQGPFAGGILIILGVAVALLGPGLFSLDFRLFGYREIVFPQRPHE